MDDASGSRPCERTNARARAPRVGMARGALSRSLAVADRRGGLRCASSKLEKPNRAKALANCPGSMIQMKNPGGTRVFCAGERPAPSRERPISQALAIDNPIRDAPDLPMNDLDAGDVRTGVAVDAADVSPARPVRYAPPKKSRWLSNAESPRWRIAPGDRRPRSKTITGARAKGYAHD